MSSPEKAKVPIMLGGWRVWDLSAGRDLDPGLTRGIWICLDRNGVVIPENDRQVTASELEMILEIFADHPLAFHVATPADENRIPSFLDKLVGRYPTLKGQTLQINPQLRPSTCEALLPVKKKHGFTIVLPHFSLYGADAWAPSVALADQVLFDAGGLRNLNNLNIDARTVDALRIVTDVSKAPLALAGKLTAVSIAELGLPFHETRALLNRDFALSGDVPLTADGSLDLEKTKAFVLAAAKLLGIELKS